MIPATGLWREYRTQWWLALGFLTRLPVPHTLDYSPERMHRALVWFPLVGWLLAALLSLAALGLQLLLGTPVTVILMVMLNLLVTGALHEDGLADCFDGFYGGMTPERRLSIMKDSRLGTYGSAALITSLLLQSVLWWQLAEAGQLLLALMVVLPLSRALAITHAQDLPYVSSRDTSKSDPLARPLSTTRLLAMLSIGLVGMCWLPLPLAGLLLLTMLLVRQALRGWMKQHIGGFTGDSLGAAQQIQALSAWLVMLGWFQPLAGSSVL